MEKILLELCGQMLHANSIEFRHPTTHEDMKVEAPLPEYFEEVLNSMKH